METTKNFVQLRGTAAGEPVPSHENHGQQFLRFPLAVRRLSGQTDTLWVIATAEQLRRLTAGAALAGRRLNVDGQLRSFNNKSGCGSRLVISVFAQLLLAAEEGEDQNRIALRGVICKPPVLRRTPLGRCISDMMLAVNRRYGRADYLPCIAWAGSRAGPIPRWWRAAPRSGWPSRSASCTWWKRSAFRACIHSRRTPSMNTGS